MEKERIKITGRLHGCFYDSQRGIQGFLDGAIGSTIDDSLNAMLLLRCELYSHSPIVAPLLGQERPARDQVIPVLQHGDGHDRSHQNHDGAEPVKEGAPRESLAFAV